MTANDQAVELTIYPKKKDLGEFTVRRVLPAREKRMVGPFVFFDHMGPAEFPPGQGIAVRPHPHIGLATITYLFEGQIMHRDSLGFAQPIECGAVNLMTAGKGIVHSERAGDDLDTTSRLHGIQSWMALPKELEEIDPAFDHYPADTLPELQIDGATIRIIMGEAYGETSPVKLYSPTIYLECVLPSGAQFRTPEGFDEVAVYVVSGDVRLDAESYTEGAMLVLRAGGTATLQAAADSRLMIIGGEPLGERHIVWNFVSSSRERIEKAKDDWRDGNFAMVPGDDEFIPLP